MNVGDLVMLSAAGQKLKRCKWVKVGDIGIVKSFGHLPNKYQVAWMTSRVNAKGHPANHWVHFSSFFERKDLKFVSRRKK
tara:strand:+ start:668 stop:907 length:240 start_codon:yes stop_codon:yes gene_type:complete